MSGRRPLPAEVVVLLVLASFTAVAVGKLVLNAPTRPPAGRRGAKVRVCWQTPLLSFLTSFAKSSFCVISRICRSSKSHSGWARAAAV